ARRTSLSFSQCRLSPEATAIEERKPGPLPARSWSSSSTAAHHSLALDYLKGRPPSSVPGIAHTVNNVRGACVDPGYRSGVCRMDTESIGGVRGVREVIRTLEIAFARNVLQPHRAYDSNDSKPHRVLIGLANVSNFQHRLRPEFPMA